MTTDPPVGARVTREARRRENRRRLLAEVELLRVRLESLIRGLNDLSHDMEEARRALLEF